MTETEYNRIFISYAKEDLRAVEELYQKLIRKKLKPWMADKDILPGERIESATKKAVQQSDFFLAVLSSKTVKKQGRHLKNLKKALDIWDEKLSDDIYLIPLRLDECDLPDSLEDTTPVDWFQADGFDRLLQAVRAGMERYGTEKQGASEHKENIPDTPDHPHPPHQNPSPNDNACTPITPNNWTFSCRPEESDARYFIEIKKENNGYTAKIHQGNPDKAVISDNLKIGRDDTVTIKNNAVPFKDLISGIIKFDKN